MSDPTKDGGDDLPSAPDVVMARGWLMAGCPAVSREHDAKKAVRVLWRLLEALPSHLPIYCWGTRENRASYGFEPSATGCPVHPIPKPYDCPACALALLPAPGKDGTR